MARMYKTAESRDSLVVANLALKQKPWVAIFCKAPPNPLDKMATTEHEDKMIRVKECLQGQHGFGSQEECQWTLKPPTDVEWFVSTKAQYVEATMDYMESCGVFVTRYDKWVDTAANVLQDDGSRIVCCLKQQCTPTGAARKWVTTVTDVMILNYAVGLNVACDGTQCNKQGVWPCKLLIDSLPLQILAMSPDLMEALRKQPCRDFPSTDVARRPTIRTHR